MIMYEKGRIDDQNVHASYFNQCNIVHMHVDTMLMGKSIFNYIDSTTERLSCLSSTVRNVSMKKQTKTCTLRLDVIHSIRYKKPECMAVKIIAWSAAIITGGYIGMRPKTTKIATYIRLSHMAQSVASKLWYQTWKNKQKCYIVVFLIEMNTMLGLTL